MHIERIHVQYDPVSVLAIMGLKKNLQQRIMCCKWEKSTIIKYDRAIMNKWNTQKYGGES